MAVGPASEAERSSLYPKSGICGVSGDRDMDEREQERKSANKDYDDQGHLRKETPSPWAVAKAVMILTVLVSSATTLLSFLAPMCFFFLRIFSIHFSRKVVSFFFGHWLAMWPFFFEKINKTKVIFSGEKVPVSERVIVLCNHRTEVDWMYIWSLALRKRSIASVKYVIKSSVRNVPIFGWAFFVLEFLLIDRKWEVDETVFESLLQTFKDQRDPLWLVIFPEGTDYTEAKCLQSQKYAEQHGLPKLKHVLLPRTKGFYSCLSHLRTSVDAGSTLITLCLHCAHRWHTKMLAVFTSLLVGSYTWRVGYEHAVYDLTVSYRTRCPLFIDNALGTDPREVHIHIKRTSICDIPCTEEEATSWLMKQFERKDELLNDFYEEGKFPGAGTEQDLSMIYGIANFAGILVSTLLLLRLLFSYAWVRVYAALSCVWLIAATYFNFKPTPIF